MVAALSAAIVAACQVQLPAVDTTVAPTPRALAAATPTIALRVAVAVGSPTPTPVLVGDYATLVRPRLEMIQQTLGRLEQQLAILQKTPTRMAEDDWRNQTLSFLEDIGAQSADLRSLTARLGAQTSIGAEVNKLTDDLDFVADEYRMALDFDPDATHFIRAGRAEKATAAEVESILSDLRHPLGIAPTPTPSG